MSKKLVAVTPLNKAKKVRFARPITSSSNIQEQVNTPKTQDSNKPLLPFTGLIASTSASRSKPTGNTKNNRISRPSSSKMQNKVEEQARKVKSRSNKKNRVSKSVSSTPIEQSMLNANSEFICVSCNGYMFDEIYNECVLDFIQNVIVVQIVLWYLDSRCSKHKTRNRSQLINFVSKFLSTVNFGNDQIAKRMGYGDYQTRNITISRVCYVEGLKHNLFSVGQFYDSDLEVAFRNQTCFVCNLKGVDLLIGSWGTNLYTLSIGDMMKSSLICVLLKASKIKSWL
ncbi:hypothetical protein Tco_1010723 [Tanacetum coccineum]